MYGSCRFLLLICITYVLAINGQHTPREALEIIIGGGGGAASPSPPPEIQDCPPPPPPPEPCSPPPLPPPPPPPPPPTKKQPPRKPPPPPPKSGFESPRLEIVYQVIQDFKKKVVDDPKGITKTWNGTDICNDYKGFKCDIVPDFNQKALSGVKFNGYGFCGPNLTLGGFMDKLPDIAFFHANSNNFTGPIPRGIGSLRYLFELDLSNNKFVGKFPNEVLGGKNLVFLDLRFNTFFGFVPPPVFLLDLDLLFINNNNFIQKLPDNLGSTRALYLSLANNKFVGEIPPSIGQASNTLLEVLFLNNRLTGCLPYEIGFLNKATVFDVGLNYLTGPIPLSFQCLKKMELLNLAQNSFYGEVPESVCSLPKLSNFTVSFNYFTQVGPQCRKLIHDGVLDVKMNCIIDLPNQRSQSDCRKFFSSPHSCRNPKSLSMVPHNCFKGASTFIESSDIQSIAPAPAPQPRTLGALSPH